MLLDLPDKSKQALLPGTRQTKEFIIFTHMRVCMTKIVEKYPPRRVFLIVPHDLFHPRIPDCQSMNLRIQAN